VTWGVVITPEFGLVFFCSHVRAPGLPTPLRGRALAPSGQLFTLINQLPTKLSAYGLRDNTFPLINWTCDRSCKSVFAVCRFDCCFAGSLWWLVWFRARSEIRKKVLKWPLKPFRVRIQKVDRNSSEQNLLKNSAQKVKTASEILCSTKGLWTNESAGRALKGSESFSGQKISWIGLLNAEICPRPDTTPPLTPC
jgi:hypothetical protein